MTFAHWQRLSGLVTWRPAVAAAGLPPRLWLEDPPMSAFERLQAQGTAVAMITLALLVTADVVLPHNMVVITSFSVAPLIAATLTTTRRTAIVAGLAVLAALVAGSWNDLPATDWVTRVVMCAVISVFAIVIAESRQRREQQLRRMTVIAEAAQRAILRGMPSEIGGVGLAARYVSASADARVGGDLYDFADTEHGLRLIVGDVRGKGIDAVQLAAAVLTAFRQSAFRRSKLVDVATDLDGVVAKIASDEDFVTAVLAEFRHDGKVALVNCGHHPPLLAARPGEPALIDTGEPALPLGMGTEPAETVIFVPPAGRLLFYTDGLVEARNRDGEFFPLPRLAAPLADGELDTAIDRLVQRVVEHARNRISDDLALVLAEQRQLGRLAVAAASRTGAVVARR